MRGSALVFQKMVLENTLNLTARRKYRGSLPA